MVSHYAAAAQKADHEMRGRSGTFVPFCPCPADLLERAALIEAGDDCDRADAFARALAAAGFASLQAFGDAHASRIVRELDRLPAPHDRAGLRLLEGTRRFLTGGHWLECLAEGWPLSDVFGVSEWAPLQGKATLGLVPRAALYPQSGRRLDRIHDAGADFREASGGLVLFRRPSLEVDVSAVVPWWKSPALVSAEAAA